MKIECKEKLKFIHRQVDQREVDQDHQGEIQVVKEDREEGIKE